MISGTIRVPGSGRSSAQFSEQRPGRADAIACPAWRGARDRTLAALLSGAKCLIVTGPPGTGKTLLLQDVARILRLAGWDATVQLHAAFPLSVVGAVTTVTRPRITLIDEADRFDPSELRSILDADGQITLLAGLDSLGDRFPGCARVTLAPLTHDESVAFISQWLIQAGHSPTLLSGAAMVRAADLSQGVPRLLVNMLKGALWLANTQGAETVTTASIEDAANLRECRVCLADPDGSAVTADVATISDQPGLPTGTNDLYRAFAKSAHKQPIPAPSPIRAHIAEVASEPDTRDSPATLQQAEAPPGLPPVTQLRRLPRVVGFPAAAACIAAGALFVMFPFGGPGRVGILRSLPGVTVEPFAPATAGVSLTPAHVTPALSDHAQSMAPPSASMPELSAPTSFASLTTAAPDSPHLAKASEPVARFDDVEQPGAAIGPQQSRYEGGAKTDAPSPPDSSARVASGLSQAGAVALDVMPVGLLALDTPRTSAFAVVPSGGRDVHPDALLQSSPAVTLVSTDPVTPGSSPDTTQQLVPDSPSALPSSSMLPVTESDQPLSSVQAITSTSAGPIPSHGEPVPANRIPFALQPSDQSVVAAETDKLPSVPALETGLFAAGDAQPADSLPKVKQQVSASASDSTTLEADGLFTAPALISNFVSRPTDVSGSVPATLATVASTQELQPSSPDALPADAAPPVPDPFRALEHRAPLVPVDITPPDTSKAATAAAPRTPLTFPLSEATLDSLIERGDQVIRVGDISAARLLYGRAASSRGEAAASMGRTFDRAFLIQIGASISPNQATAAEWYRRAIALGNKEAVTLLQRLEARGGN